MLSSNSASAIAAAIHLHASLQLALPRSMLPDDHLLLACRSDGAVAACARPRATIGELRKMSKLREHAREVGRARISVWTGMLVERVKRLYWAAGMRALCAQMSM